MKRDPGDDDGAAGLGNRRTIAAGALTHALIGCSMPERPADWLEDRSVRCRGVLNVRPVYSNAADLRCMLIRGLERTRQRVHRPVAAFQVRCSNEAPEPVQASSDARMATRPRGLLIVDDNGDSVQALELLARSWGHEVAVAKDGLSALQLAASFKPEFAVVDSGLPGMNGYEIARRLREDVRYRTPYLVALTGYGAEKDRADARAAGFDEHWIKPGDLNLLEALLARAG